MENLNQEYIPPEERIYDVVSDLNVIDWKSFLYELIHKENLNPWDIDISILTNKYLLALKNLKKVDFNLSGKFLTVAIFLLKTKSEKLITTDIRGFETEVEQLQNESDDLYEDLENLEEDYNNLEENSKKEYKLKFRNPIARKRKVNIFDLIKTLEKTFEQSNKRKANFLQRNPHLKYDGPTYEKKKKDLKEIIEDLFNIICEEFSTKSGHISFNHLIKNSKTKLDILDKFIPLLHLHNHTKIELKQNKHFDEIEIHRIK